MKCPVVPSLEQSHHRRYWGEAAHTGHWPPPPAGFPGFRALRPALTAASSSVSGWLWGLRLDPAVIVLTANEADGQAPVFIPIRAAMPGQCLEGVSSCGRWGTGLRPLGLAAVCLLDPPPGTGCALAELGGGRGHWAWERTPPRPPSASSFLAFHWNGPLSLSCLSGAAAVSSGVSLPSPRPWAGWGGGLQGPEVLGASQLLGELCPGPDDVQAAQIWWQASAVQRWPLLPFPRCTCPGASRPVSTRPSSHAPGSAETPVHPACAPRGTSVLGLGEERARPSSTEPW